MRITTTPRFAAQSIWFGAALAVMAALLLHTMPAASAEPTSTPQPHAAPVDDTAIDDGAHLLGPGDRKAVLAAMHAFSADTNITITVVTTSATGGQGIQAYATAHAARTGRDRGEAVVLGIDMGARQAGIYTTPAAQSKLPDSEAHAVISDVLQPAAHNGLYGKGLIDSIDELNAYLNDGGVDADAQGVISGWTVCWMVVIGFGMYGLAQLFEWASDRRGRRERVAAIPADRRAALRALESSLGELSSDQARFKKAHRATGVSRSEWNVLYPNWWIHAAAINASNAAAVSSAADATDSHPGSSRSSYTDTSSSSSNYTGFTSGSSFGGFDGGGGATGGF